MKLLQKMLHSIIALLVLMSFIKCSKDIGGRYKLVEGDCAQSLIIKNLGGGKYNIILQGDDMGECELLGKITGNKISALAGTTPIHFITKDYRLILLIEDKECTFEKFE